MVVTSKEKFEKLIPLIGWKPFPVEVIGDLLGPEEGNVVLPCETTAVGRDANWLDGSTCFSKTIISV